MAAADVVHPDRLDKPSLMLTGQPEKEVREQSHLTLTVNEMKCILASRLPPDYENCIISTPASPEHHISIAVRRIALMV